MLLIFDDYHFFFAFVVYNNIFFEFLRICNFGKLHSASLLLIYIFHFWLKTANMFEKLHGINLNVNCRLNIRNCGRKRFVNSYICVLYIKCLPSSYRIVEHQLQQFCKYWRFFSCQYCITVISMLLQNFCTKIFFP